MWMLLTLLSCLAAAVNERPVHSAAAANATKANSSSGSSGLPKRVLAAARAIVEPWIAPATGSVFVIRLDDQVDALPPNASEVQLRSFSLPPVEQLTEDRRASARPDLVKLVRLEPSSLALPSERLSAVREQLYVVAIGEESHDDAPSWETLPPETASDEDWTLRRLQEPPPHLSARSFMGLSAGSLAKLLRRQPAELAPTEAELLTSTEAELLLTSTEFEETQLDVIAARVTASLHLSFGMPASLLSAMGRDIESLEVRSHARTLCNRSTQA